MRNMLGIRFSLWINREKEEAAFCMVILCVNISFIGLLQGQAAKDD